MNFSITMSKWLKEKKSLLFLFLFGIGFLITTIDCVIIKRKHSIHIQDNPNGLITKIKNYYPYRCSGVFSVDEENGQEIIKYELLFNLVPFAGVASKVAFYDYQKLFVKNNKRMFLSDPRSISTSVNMATQSVQNTEKLHINKDARWYVSKDDCLVNVITKKLQIGTLMLSTGNRDNEQDFLGYDILQEATFHTLQANTKVSYNNIFSEKMHTCMVSIALFIMSFIMMSSY